MLCDDLDGWDEGVGRSKRDICIHTADSFHCTAESNNIVKQLYSNKDVKNKQEKVSFVTLDEYLMRV